MVAISNLNRTIYACNLFQKVPNMLAIIKILFSRDSSKNHSYVTLGQFLTFQAYLVLFVIMIAIIFGPCHNNYGFNNYVVHPYMLE